MQTYLIERVFGHVDAELLEAGGSASKRVALDQFAGALVWRRSYAGETAEGLVTYCLFESPDEATIRAHAVAAGLPCTRITAVGIVGPDDFD